MINFVQLLFTGISVGVIYGLVALGFVLIYKASKIFNTIPFSKQETK